MPKPTRLIPVLTKSVEKIQRDNMLESIDGLRRRIDAGEVSRFGLVECRTNGDYTTEFTSAMHKREDAAMLIDLALRLMGFVSRNKDDEFV
jgi:molybdate-binding protein